MQRPHAAVLRALLQVLALVAGMLCMPARDARALGGGASTASTASTARAALPNFAITMVSDTLLTLDSNSPCNSGPHTMYVQFRVTNRTAVQQRNLTATISGFSGGIGLAGGQVALQYVAPLDPGETANVYWFATYPCSFNVLNTLVVTVSNGATITETGTARVRTASMISAQAGGNLASQTLEATTLGGIATIDVEYEFGGANPGDTYNLQPSGETSLNAGCFQLVATQVTASTVTAIPAGAMFQQNFVAAVKNPGSGFRATIRYYFRVLCLGVSSTAKPYANMQSGNTNLKYSGNYDNWGGGTGGTTIPSSSNPFVIAKGASADTLADSATVTFTVTIQNTASQFAIIDSIADVLPAGVTYAGLAATSQVTAANSNTIPAAGAAGRVVFRSVPGVWYVISPGATLTLAYRTKVPSPEGTYTNSVRAYVGYADAGGATRSVVVRWRADLSVAKLGADSARVGDTLRFVLRTTNLGPSKATAVTLVDTLPAGAYTFVRASRGGTLAGGRVVSWPALATLPKDSVASDTVVVVAAGAGTAVNLAAASGAVFDPVAANSNGTAAASRVTTTLRVRLVGVVVTPDGITPALRRLPGGGYAQTFVVQNTGASAQTFDLLLSVVGGGAVVVRDSVTGPGLAAAVAGDSARVTIASSASQTYTVFYRVPAGDTAQAALRLRARHAAAAATFDDGWADVRRVFPTLTLAKSVSPNTNISPGVDLTYAIQFANVGEYDARSTVVVDQVPSQVLFKVGSVTTTLPSGVTGTVAYSSDGGSTWTYTPAAGGCGAPAGYDGCVTRLRLSLGSDLPIGAAASSGTLRFVARVR